MNLSKIHHIAIIASDYEAAKNFYVNKLGFSVIRENYRPERKDWKLDLRVNELTELEIFAEENPPKRVNRPEACGLRHLAFCVDSVEQTVNELAEVPLLFPYCQCLLLHGVLLAASLYFLDCSQKYIFSMVLFSHFGESR